MHTSKNLFLSLVLLGGTLGGSSVGGQELFTEPQGGVSDARSAVAAADPTVLRSRPVGVDWQWLSAATPDEPRAVAKMLALNFFPDAQLTAVFERGELRTAEDFTWQGRIEGVPESTVTLVRFDGVLAGNVRAGDRYFQIRYMGDGVHSVRQIDDSLFPDDGEPIAIDLAPGERAAEPNPDDPGRLDVMAVYTPAARSIVGGTAAMRALINLAVVESNTAYTRSAVSPRIRLVYAGEMTGYTENGGFSTELNRIANPSDGFMDEVHGLRNAFGADLVSLIIRGDGSLCGIGFLMNTLSAGFASNAFSVSAYNCATGNYTFSHEMGHNMGLRHDRIADPSAGLFPYSHGYVDATNNFRTIMGVASGCGGCPRIQNFSNPNVLFNGFPTGVPQASASSADAAASLNGTASVVANWRTQVVDVDYGPDGKSDVGVFRGGAWLVHDFASGAQTSATWTGSFPGCIPAVLDFNGDGRTDFSQYCNGAWYFYNADGSLNKSIWVGGVAGDVPVPADYNGDGRDEVVIYRGGAWLFYDFATGAFDAARSVWTGGGVGCVPAPMDYDGDFRDDITQLCNGAWHFYNADGSYNKGIWTVAAAGALPAPADYDGDGRDDVVVFLGGAWLFYDFATGAYLPASSVWTGAPPHFTGGTPLPAPMDFDGDGRADFTVYSGGPWHFYDATGVKIKEIWTGGLPGDQPLSRRLLP